MLKLTRSSPFVPQAVFHPMRGGLLRACEFVTPGHPDKICDQMADAIVDEAIKQDPKSRVAMEVTGGHGLVVVIGEITTNAKFNISELLHNIYKDIGHDGQLEITVRVVEQSRDIGQGVDAGGAGDQGIMHGYAISGERDFMPLEYNVARDLSERLVYSRRSGAMRYLGPDGKTQVSLHGQEVRQVTVAAQHGDASAEQVRTDVINCIVQPVIGSIDESRVVVNGTGKFVQGGFDADAGTTGRKLMIDNYGPNVMIGGGAYSGKDPSKVDRSAAYFNRFVAKSIVANEMAKEAYLHTAYAIGQAEPTLVAVETDLAETEARKLEQKIREAFDFRPAAMIERLGLLQPRGWSYRETASAGHYGDDRFPWEQPVSL